jgi:peroxiredoxin
VLLIASLAGALWLGPYGAAALQSGDTAPSFSAPTLQGRTLSLESLRGKVVFLDFWASWCAPCAQSLPVLDALRGEFGPEDFQVLAVNVDRDPRKAEDFLSRRPVGYPSVSDPEGALPVRFGVQTMPTSFLIDREGVIRYVHRGFRKGDEDVLRARIRELMGRGR